VITTCSDSFNQVRGKLINTRPLAVYLLLRQLLNPRSPASLSPKYYIVTYISGTEPSDFSIISPIATMATWFTIVGRIAQIEGISDYNYKNALIEFEEGDFIEKEFSSWRSFYVAFWGDLLHSG
jgi:hypothetical protein